MERLSFIMLIAAVYISGFAATYLLTRDIDRKNDGKWTKFKRSMALLNAIMFSWNRIIAIKITELVFPKQKDFDKPAKW